DDFAALHRDAYLVAFVVRLEADARALAGLGVDGHHFRRENRLLALEDPALGTLRGRAHVALHEVDALDRDLAFLVEDARDLAGLALVFSADDDDGVAFPEPRGHHSTSGASEMIFMNFLPRSSRATGPKMRVPTGSSCALMRTALFSSKRMYVPSGRGVSCLVRTTTALAVSPFFTLLPGSASLIDTTMTSPTEA